MLLQRASIVGVLLALATVAHAGTITVALGDTGFLCQNVTNSSACNSDPVSIWDQTDYVGEKILPGSSVSISQLSYDLEYSNVLVAGFSEIYNVTVNGTSVDTFTIDGPGDATHHTQSNTVTFSPITGTEFDVLFTITSTTIPVSDGSVGWTADGSTSTISITDASGASEPEPATLALGFLGLGLGAAFRRRLRSS